MSGEPVAVRQPVAVLFSSAFAVRTFSLWICYFMGLLVIYLSTNWLPTMMKDADMSIDRAADTTAMFQLGGTVGAIVAGLVTDRFGAARFIATAYRLGGVSLVLFGLGGLGSAWLALVSSGSAFGGCSSTSARRS